MTDYVGRSMAEAAESTESWAVTLTYADDRPDSVGSVLLLYGDFQRFMKRLRKAGFSVRYLVAGEYGTLKGRAHWHALLFFRGKVPDLPFGDRVQWKAWPHGHCHVQLAHERSAAYVCKYLLKDQTGGPSERRLAMSKLPPLGWDYLARSVDAMVAQGLAPRDFGYKVGGSRPHVAGLRPAKSYFHLHGDLRFRFAQLWLERWQIVRGVPPPPSPAIDRLVLGASGFDALNPRGP